MDPCAVPMIAGYNLFKNMPNAQICSAVCGSLVKPERIVILSPEHLIHNTNWCKHCYYVHRRCYEGGARRFNLSFPNQAGPGSCHDLQMALDRFVLGAQY